MVENTIVASFEARGTSPQQLQELSQKYNLKLNPKTTQITVSFPASQTRQVQREFQQAGFRLTFSGTPRGISQKVQSLQSQGDLQYSTIFFEAQSSKENLQTTLPPEAIQQRKEDLARIQKIEQAEKIQRESSFTGTRFQGEIQPVREVEQKKEITFIGPFPIIRRPEPKLETVSLIERAQFAVKNPREALEVEGIVRRGTLTPKGQVLAAETALAIGSTGVTATGPKLIRGVVSGTSFIGFSEGQASLQSEIQRREATGQQIGLIQKVEARPEVAFLRAGGIGLAAGELSTGLSRVVTPTRIESVANVREIARINERSLFEVRGAARVTRGTFERESADVLVEGVVGTRPERDIIFTRSELKLSEVGAKQFEIIRTTGASKQFNQQFGISADVAKTQKNLIASAAENLKIADTPKGDIFLSAGESRIGSLGSLRRTEQLGAARVQKLESFDFDFNLGGQGLAKKSSKSTSKAVQDSIARSVQDFKLTQTRTVRPTNLPRLSTSRVQSGISQVQRGRSISFIDTKQIQRKSVRSALIQPQKTRSLQLPRTFNIQAPILSITGAQRQESKQKQRQEPRQKIILDEVSKLTFPSFTRFTLNLKPPRVSRAGALRSFIPIAPFVFTPKPKLFGDPFKRTAGGGKQRRKYSPSVVGIEQFFSIGKTTALPKAPKGLISGFGIRPVVFKGIKKFKI